MTKLIKAKLKFTLITNYSFYHLRIYYLKNYTLNSVSYCSKNRHLKKYFNTSIVNMLKRMYLLFYNYFFGIFFHVRRYTITSKSISFLAVSYPISPLILAFRCIIMTSHMTLSVQDTYS